MERAYPAEPWWALRAANFREACMLEVYCKTCQHFDGFNGRCNRFKHDVSMGMVCDEWVRRGVDRASRAG